LKHKDAHIAKLEEEIQESKTSTNTSLKENNLQISELNKRVTELISQSALRLHEKYQQITALSRGVAEQEARLARRTQNFEDVQVQLDIHEKQVQDWQAREGKHQKNTREKVQSVSDKFRLREPRMQQLFHNVKSLQKQLATLGQPKQEYHPREKAEFEQLKDVVEDIQAQLKEKHDVQNSNQSQVEGLDKRIEDIQHQLSVHQEKEQESRIRDQDHIHDLSQQIKEVQTELSTQNTNSATMSRDETSTPAIVKTGLDSLEINVSKVKTKVSSFVLPTIHQHGEDIAELQFQMKELYPLKAADTKELEDTSKVKPSVRKGEVPLSETDDEIQSGKKRKPDVELGSAVKVARHRYVSRLRVLDDCLINIFRASNRKAFIPIPVVDNSDDSDYVPPLETTITGYPRYVWLSSIVTGKPLLTSQPV
jgi:chromosome segregation ATPase